MSENERLKKMISWLISQGIVDSQEDLANKLNYNSSSVSQIVTGIKPLSKKFANNLAKLSNKINIDYLLGEGEMLKNDSIETKLLKGVPYWNLPVTAGRSIMDIIGKTNPDGYISGLPGADMAENILPVIGTSMEPEILNGAIVGVRKMNNWETLNTERIYLIITRDDRMVKRIEYDLEKEDILWCVSPNYPKFKIYKSDIIDIERVCFVYNPK
jgi:transcriptional regulator with XRE-family HTH domain